MGHYLHVWCSPTVTELPRKEIDATDCSGNFADRSALCAEFMQAAHCERLRERPPEAEEAGGEGRKTERHVSNWGERER